MKKFIKIISISTLMVTSQLANATSHWTYNPLWQDSLWLYKYTDNNHNDYLHAVEVIKTTTDSSGYAYHQVTGLKSFFAEEVTISAYHGTVYQNNYLWLKSESEQWHTMLDFSAGSNDSANYVALNPCLSYQVQAQDIEHNVSTPTGTYHYVKGFNFNHTPQSAAACDNNYADIWQKMRFAPYVGLIEFTSNNNHYELVYANIYGDNNFTQSSVSVDNIGASGITTTMLLSKDSFSAGANKYINTSFVMRNNTDEIIDLSYNDNTPHHTWLEDEQGYIVAVGIVYPPYPGRPNIALEPGQAHHLLNVNLAIDNVLPGRYLLKGRADHDNAITASLWVTIK